MRSSWWACRRMRAAPVQTPDQAPPRLQKQPAKPAPPKPQGQEKSGRGPEDRQKEQLCPILPPSKEESRRCRAGKAVRAAGSRRPSPRASGRAARRQGRKRRRGDPAVRISSSAGIWSGSGTRSVRTGTLRRCTGRKGAGYLLDQQVGLGRRGQAGRRAIERHIRVQAGGDAGDPCVESVSRRRRVFEADAGFHGRSDGGGVRA